MDGPAMHLSMLVVDDDDVDRERVRRFLARSPLDVDLTEAASGAEALSLVRARAFDCVVLDNQLGDTDGAALLGQLRREARRDFPVIFITGAGSESLAVHVMHGGASDYLSKSSLDEQALVRSIRRSVETHRLQVENEDLRRRLESRVEEQAVALRQRERDLSLLVDNSPYLISSWDLERRCRFGNRRHGDWLGTSADTLPGMRLADLLGQELATMFEMPVQRVLRGAPCSFECRLPVAGGPPLDVEVQLVPDIDDAAGVQGFYLSIADVGAQKRSQEALVQARDAAQAATRAKSSFLANMSHEIRTPMNAIVGLSRLALQREMPDSSRAYLEKVHHASLALMGLLDDVLDYSKIEAGRLRIERVAIDLQELLQRTADLFQARLDQQDLTLAMSLSADVPRFVWGDPLRLSQVLNNLVGNAVKFTHAGGIQVRVRREPGPMRGNGVPLRFEVEDTGIGIPGEVCEMLFEAFVQADDSITRRFGGSGLGLAICRRLVEMMGGRIGVTSTPGVGSRFWFSLALEAAPAAAPPASEAGLERPSHAPGARMSDLALPLRGLRLLLVEDNPLNRIVASELLRSAGLEVDVAVDGSEGVRRFAEAPPGHYRAILMDLHMPNLDGLEATRLIRALPHGRRVPIVAMTAAAMPEDRERCLAAGMDDHLSKPVLPEQCIELLLRLIGRAAAGPGSGDVDPVPAEGRAGALAGRLDLGRLLDVLHGDRALAADLLTRFVALEGDAGDRISALLERGERASAAEAVHDLKGCAATVGAAATATAAGRLQLALGREGDAAHELDALRAALSTDLSAIAQMLERLEQGDRRPQ